MLGRFVLTTLLFMLVSFLHAYELVLFAIRLSGRLYPGGWIGGTSRAPGEQNLDSRENFGDSILRLRSIRLSASKVITILGPNSREAQVGTKFQS